MSFFLRLRRGYLCKAAKALADSNSASSLVAANPQHTSSPGFRIEQIVQ